MPIIVVDPEDGGTQAGTRLPEPAGFQKTPIREKLNEPIDPAGSCCVLDGKPCILYGDWDYGEDWSGEFVLEMHPFMLVGAPSISVDEFWKIVKSIEDERQKMKSVNSCQR